MGFNLKTIKGSMGMTIQKYNHQDRKKANVEKQTLRLETAKQPRGQKMNHG
jgi:hypothetical protein